MIWAILGIGLMGYVAFLISPWLAALYGLVVFVGFAGD